MKVYTLDVDSSQRNPTLYAYANSYVVRLDDPVYDVSKIELVSARIPTPQRNVDVTNQTFSVSGVDVTLPARDYANVHALSEALQTALAPPRTNVDAVTYADDVLTFSNTAQYGHFTFEFYSGTRGYLSNTMVVTTPHQQMGFASDDYSSNVNYSLTSGAVDLTGPSALYLRLTAGSYDFKKVVHTGTPLYTGKILLDGSNYINFSGADDPVVHDLYTAPQPVMDSLKIEFFYMSHGRLIPYDFRNIDHSLKFKITCSKDRLENLARYVEPEELVLPPPIKVEVNKNDLYKWVPIGVIIVVGILLMTFIGPRPRTPDPSGVSLSD